MDKEKSRVLGGETDWKLKRGDLGGQETALTKLSSCCIVAIVSRYRNKKLTQRLFTRPILHAELELESMYA